MVAFSGGVQDEDGMRESMEYAHGIKCKGGVSRLCHVVGIVFANPFY